MKQFAFVFVFVAFVLFVGVSSAEAQYYNPNPVQSLIQGNLNMVHNLHGQLDRARWDNQVHNLVYHDGYYGNYGQDGYFYGQYDREGRRLSRPVKFAIGGGLIGASLGYGISGKGRGAAIGGAIGAVVGLIAGRDRGQQQQPQYQPQQDDYQQQSQYQQPQEQAIPQQVSIPVPEPQSAEPQGEFRLVNKTSFSLDIYDGNTFLGRMKPGESWGADAPKVAFHADARIPNNSGGISIDSADMRATDTGWEFVPPTVAQGGVL